MSKRAGLWVFVSLYCLLLATGIGLGALDLLGLPFILIISAAGGLLHLG